MAGREESGFPNPTAASVREKEARLILRTVRSDGHTCVELRNVGKRQRCIFFCILCLSPCHGKTDLLAHLEGKRHNRRLDTARSTLMKRNPWPFNDGLTFFHNSPDYDFVVPGILRNGKISDLGLNFIGIGQIGGRFFLTDDIPNGHCTIWCEWLGKKSLKGSDSKHNFAVVTFTYKHHINLDKNWDTEDVEDGSEKRTSSSKGRRRKLRRQQGLYDEKICSLCSCPILPGKDVATLLNMKTGRLACSSRNTNGVFHVFHISCLVHWILLCEIDIVTLNEEIFSRYKKKIMQELDEIPVTQGSSGQTGSQSTDEFISSATIKSALCPECQGTGMVVKKMLEVPTFIERDQIFNYKLKMCHGRRDWMRRPEVLSNCSIGLHFPSKSDEISKELNSTLDVLCFYRGDA